MMISKKYFIIGFLNRIQSRKRALKTIPLIVMLVASHELVQKTVAIATAVLQEYHEYNYCYPALSSGLIRKHSRDALWYFFFTDYAGTLRLKEMLYCQFDCSFSKV